MSNITKTRIGMTTCDYIGNNNITYNTTTDGSNSLSMFNKDGSVSDTTKSKYAGNSCGAWDEQNQNKSGGSKMTAWSTENGNPVTQNNGVVNSAPSLEGTSWSFADDSNTSTTTTPVTTTTQSNLSPSGANWGDKVLPQTPVSVSNAPDLVANAVESIKNLAGKILDIVPNLNDDEFNNLVNIYELAGLKDEFLELSGRKNSYLDRALVTEALNEANMVFTENNTNNSNLNSTLTRMVQVLNSSGHYDARNVYDFLEKAMASGMIPQTVWNDPMRRNLARVCQMANNYKKHTGQYGSSGANWNRSAVVNNNVNNNGLTYQTNMNNQVNTNNTDWGAWVESPTTQNNNNCNSYAPVNIPYAGSPTTTVSTNVNPGVAVWNQQNGNSGNNTPAYGMNSAVMDQNPIASTGTGNNYNGTQVNMGNDRVPVFN